MEDIHDLKPLMQLDFPWVAFLILGVTVLLFMGLMLWGIRHWWRKRRQRINVIPEVVTPAIPEVDPRVTALKNLSYLTPNPEAPDIFYERLEYILRRFLEDITHLPVTSYTASELTAFFQKKTSESSSGMGALTGFFNALQHGEQAKFAKGISTSQTQKDDLETVKTMVKNFKG